MKVRALPAAARLPLLLYRSLFPLAFTLMLPGFLARMLRRGNYRHKFGQRFGIFSVRDRQRLEPGGWTWIHAVSVGEMMMALKLARALRHVTPGLRVLISTTTSTGFAVGRERIDQAQRQARDQGKEQAEGDMELIYYPLDLATIVRRVLSLLRPARIVLVDKELWPNLVAECYRRSIPVSIVNARLSPKSERGFLRWRRWVGPFFGMLDQVCVQEPEEIARWHSLGVRREALHCTGSLKFDFAVPGESRAPEFRALLEQIGVHPAKPPGSTEAPAPGNSADPADSGDSAKGNTPILLAGSTFPGEEAILARVFLKIRVRTPALFLILAPRHVERTPEVEALLREAGLRYLLRSEIGRFESGSPRPDVLIVNTTGELRDWYAVATACFVGKSLTATGGQNPAEPVLAGRPAIFGPHMENFSALVRQFLAVGGALQVRDEAGLEEAVRRLLADPACGVALAGNARTALRAHEGANRRTAELLLFREKNG